MRPGAGKQRWSIVGTGCHYRGQWVFWAGKEFFDIQKRKTHIFVLSLTREDGFCHKLKDRSGNEPKPQTKHAMEIFKTMLIITKHKFLESDEYQKHNRVFLKNKSIPFHIQVLTSHYSSDPLLNAFLCPESPRSSQGSNPGVLHQQGTLNY